jgi:hypothetical protein
LSEAPGASVALMIAIAGGGEVLATHVLDLVEAASFGV